MQKWEYTTVYHPSERELNKLGDEGWELVSVAAEVSGNENDISSTVTAYLKRPKK
jgi:hypothetical protein